MATHNANTSLHHWNSAPANEAAQQILPCCGSHAWAEALSARRPFASPESLLATSDLVWQNLPEDAWREAFDSHPRIGQHHARAATAESLAWSAEEQRAAVSPDQTTADALSQANRDYEAKFGHIFIVCANGKTAPEILALCRTRLHNDPATEILEAAEQQRQITQLRLRRWLGLQ